MRICYLLFRALRQVERVSVFEQETTCCRRRILVGYQGVRIKSRNTGSSNNGLILLFPYHYADYDEMRHPRATKIFGQID